MPKVSLVDGKGCGQNDRDFKSTMAREAALEK